jgi:hypothetical protein
MRQTILRRPTRILMKNIYDSLIPLMEEDEKQQDDYAQEAAETPVIANQKRA